MTAFMLRNKKTGEFYRRARYPGPQKHAAIWPSKHGPAAVKSSMLGGKGYEWEYVEYDLIEKVK